MNSKFRLGLVGLAVLAFTGCPEVPPPDPLPASPSITSFTASASQVAAGATVTLSWKVENATSVRIDELSLGQVSGVSGNEGTVDVSVGGDSTYVLTVRNDRGAADSAVLSVRVSGAARELLLVAVPEQVAAGQPTTLAWSAPGATSVTLSGTPGGAVDVQGQAASGSVVVTPSVSTEYTLTANGRSRTVSVTVAPTVTSLSATSTATDAGSTVTVSWTTLGATSLQLTGAGRGTLTSVTDAAQVASGSFTEALPSEIDPGQYFSYELTAVAAGSSTSRTIIFAVPGNPAVISFTGPTVVRGAADAGTVSLAWQTAQAASLSIAADGVEFYRAAPEDVGTGSISLPSPAADTEYVLTARGARGGEATANLLIDVVGAPTVALTATPTSVNAGDAVTLSWTGTDIRNVTIREVGYGPVFAATGMQDTGTATVRPNADVAYTIDVDNSLGDTATATVNVTVTNPITLTVAETGALRFGQTVNVSATVAGDLAGLPHDTVQVRMASTGFDDISTTGTQLTFPAAAESASITTGFRMPYFGRIVGQKIRVSHHGYLGFYDVNGANSADEALPTAYLEDMVVAPYWEALATSIVRWEVKGSVLIVQWNAGTSVFQTKLHTSGQIDFEYSALPTPVEGRTGLTGLVREQTLVAPAAAAVGTGFTFFGPRAQPVPVKVWTEGALQAELQTAGGGGLRLSTPLTTVVRPEELVVNEVLSGSSAGANATWVELRNSRATAIDLAGWTFALADGGALPLSGTVPARGLLVLGASTDPVANGDAGVQVAVPNFDLTGETQLVLSRGGVASTTPLAGADGGTALVTDIGPYRYSAGAAGPQRCAATATYGSFGHRGTPGTDSHCGFGYDLTAITPAYFDISDAGTGLFTSFDETVATVSLTAAPVPFFGTSRTQMFVSTNGFVSFDAADTFDYLGAEPSASDSNLLIGAFVGDLTTSVGQVYLQRVGPGVDPAAPAAHWVLQWHRYSIFLCTSDLNFQLKFFDDGVIEAHYDKLLGLTVDQCPVEEATTAWLENLAGTQALTVSSQGTRTTPGIRPYTAFRYSPR